MSWLSSVSHAFSRTLSSHESSTDLAGASSSLLPDDDDGAIASTVSTRKKKSNRSVGGSSRSSNTSQQTDQSIRSFSNSGSGTSNPVTPRTMSASGSHVISGILQDHPHFSVFKKSASQQSLEEVLAQGEEEDILDQLSQSRSRLSPYSSSAGAPRGRVVSPSRRFPHADDSGEFHFSSVDESSLQFGDTSRQARNGPSPHSQQVVFSPLGISSSPLLAVSQVSPALNRKQSLPDVKKILKSAGTPGTGKSVRFTRSTREGSEKESPRPTATADAPVESQENKEQQRPTFLQKLQAAIPSPDNSLVQSSTLLPSPPVEQDLTQREPKSSEESNLFETSAPNHDPSQSLASVDGEEHSRAPSRDLNASTTTIRHVPVDRTPASYRRSESIREMYTHSAHADEIGRLTGQSSPLRASVQSEDDEQEEAAVRDSLIHGATALPWSPDNAVSPTGQLSSLAVELRDVIQAAPFDVDEDEQAGADEERQRLALSPISERSEPNTTVDSFSVVSNMPSPTITHSVSISQLLMGAPPSSRRQSGMVTPSKNPFAYQGAHSSDLNLIHSLLTAQGDMLANSSSQKFLLSSLVTNLRAEVDRKDAMIANLRLQKSEIEKAWQAAVDEAGEWERSVLPRSQSYRDRTQLQALEDLVERLTNELETRTSAEKRSVKKHDAEVAALRSDLQKFKADARDAEVRLRQAKIAQSESESARHRAEAERELLSERLEEATESVETMRRERDDARLKRPSDDASTHEEVQRTVTEQAQTIADLREQLRSLREEHLNQEQSQRSEVAKFDLVNADLEVKVSELEDELAEEKRLRQIALDNIEDSQQRVGEVEGELERLLEEARMKDEELEREKRGWADSRLHAERLATRLVDTERDLKLKAEELASVREEMAASLAEAERLIDDRDRRLAEAQQEVATKAAKYDVVCKELNRTKEVVAVLRRESADREVKLAKMRKVRDELQEDIIGLNIALDAKQQEAALWKRQVSASRIPVSAVKSSGGTARPRSALSTASRVSINAMSPASPMISRIPSNVSLASNASDVASETPSKARWRPTIGYVAGNGDTGTVKAKRRSSARSAASSIDKENEAPTSQSANTSTTAVIPLGTAQRRRSMLNLA